MGLSRTVLASASALTLCGCSAKLPGELVGAYRITMQLEQNTCGESAVLLSDGHRYAAELRADPDEGRGYWRVPERPPLQGAYKEGRFRFTYAAIAATSSPDAGGPVCQILQNETLSGRVARADALEDGAAADAGAEPLDGGSDASDAGFGDAGAPPASGLLGEHVLVFSAAPGTDCAQALPPRGPFQTLPCQVRYSLKGSDRKPF